jgi:tetratricopeptide (TPR) repeat protein
MTDPLSWEETFSPEKFKLAQALARNPQSVLFLPLAEEFMKAGRLSEAIVILEEGLATHPTSQNARVALGRAYYQAGNNAKARLFLEEVVQSNPQNLLAQRTLAEIYVEENALGPAMRACSVLLAANPKDEEVQALKAVIERRLQPPLEFDVQELRQATLSADPSADAAVVSPSSSSSGFGAEPLQAEHAPEARPSAERTRAWKIQELRRWLDRIERRLQA